MTYERIAISLLSRCSFLPGSWDKRFVRSLDAKPESESLSPAQREHLWRLMRKYRRQLPPRAQFGPDEFFRCSEEERSMQHAIEAAMDDDAPKLIYADWLDEHESGHTLMTRVKGQVVFAMKEQLRDAYRWLGLNHEWPRLKPQGQSYGPEGTKPINFAWNLSMSIWEKFRINYWHNSWQEAVADLAYHLASHGREWNEVPTV